VACGIGARLSKPAHCAHCSLPEKHGNVYKEESRHLCSRASDRTPTGRLRELVVARQNPASVSSRTRHSPVVDIGKCSMCAIQLVTTWIFDGKFFSYAEILHASLGCLGRQHVSTGSARQSANAATHPSRAHTQVGVGPCEQGFGRNGTAVKRVLCS
jgi:hypothetical protein